MTTELLSLVKEVRASGPQGAGAFLTIEGEQEMSIFEGAEPAGPESLWGVGSITKTVTATTLAALVLRGTVRLDTTIGEVLGEDAGAAADRTLLQLATHTSGLPRLPGSKAEKLRRGLSTQPYADLDEAGVVQALRRAKPIPPGTFAYSNFGYLALGLVLMRASGLPLSTLMHREVLDPLGLHGVRVGALEPDDDYLPGYSRGKSKPRWIDPIPACGGIAASLPDLRTWAEANLEPEQTPIADAIRLAQTEHRPGSTASSAGGLGWMYGKTSQVVWHNGADSGNYALMVIDHRLRLAFGFVANCWTGKEPETTVNAWLQHRLLPLIVEGDQDAPGTDPSL